MPGSHRLLQRIEKLTEIGIALSAESDTPRLLEMILLGAKALTNADGGTLYSVQEDNTVKMEIVRTDSLQFAMGGTTGEPIPFEPIPLYDEQGRPNQHMVVTHAVLNDVTVNIPDAYDTEGFDFSGTKKFDRSTGYRSTSFLTVPLKNHEGDIIGVLQLLNAQDEQSGEIIAFDDEAQHLVESLASLAAIALTNRRLIDDLKHLLESLIQLVATAIDEKSPYTGGHCKRVPVLTMMLADAASHTTEGPLRDFSMDEDDRYELEIAAWLHDCGKITTPEYVVDKSTKLETIYDRIETVDTRFEILKRDAEIVMLKKRQAALERGELIDEAALQQEYRDTLHQLDEELDFLHISNTGGEFMSEQDRQRVHDIGRRHWNYHGSELPLLTENERYNLTIEKGTLTPEEREVINNHIVATIKMLEALPFPKHLKHVPEYAGGHHEKMDGSGYPRGLKGSQMSVQARTMAIADIFDALTAKDRPYKEGKKLSEALRILGFMKQGDHIDPDLFDIFVRERIFEKYAHQYLDSSQIDEVDLESIPGL
ncbi:MAG: GAF domain-containing protein [Gammaproteobacteria bacterium]|nr:GAF domain-containing protein [Gammaproteobacteria bacterium]MCW8992365.1 GAF domain-containing protein [Gammaproteobacteria bacterium]